MIKRVFASLLLLSFAIAGCEKRHEPIGSEYFYAFNKRFETRSIDIERRDQHGRFTLVYPNIYASAGDAIEHNRIVIFSARSAEHESFNKVAVFAASAGAEARNISPLVQGRSNAKDYDVFKDFGLTAIHKQEAALEVVLVRSRYVPSLPSSLSIQIPWANLEEYLHAKQLGP